MSTEETNNAKTAAPDPNQLFWQFEARVSALAGELVASSDADEQKALLERIVGSLEARSGLITAATEYVKYSITASGAALAIFIGFIYTHNAIDLSNAYIAGMMILSVFALLLSLIFGFVQYARLQAQQQSQQMRIAFAKAGGWDELHGIWILARNKEATNGIFDVRVTSGIDILVAVLFFAGSALGVLCWLVSFFTLV